jgi:hypothetical protein
MTRLSPMEEAEVLDEITLGLVAVLPPGWGRLVVEYGVVDGRVRVGSGLKMADGSFTKVQVPRTLAPLFAKLRRDNDWHQLDLIIDPPSTYHAKYHR